MLPTNKITTAQARVARIEGLASSYRQPYPTTPARIGLNRRKRPLPQWASVFAAVIGVAIFAAALGLLAGSLLR